MQSSHHRSVCLSIVSTDLPVWSGIETSATLYPKGSEQFHLLLTEPVVCDRNIVSSNQEVATLPLVKTPRLLWLEFSPYRVNLTMQGNGQFSYRHMWEPGVYGLSRYWLSDSLNQSEQFRLRNFTRRLVLEGEPVPRLLRLEYELWCEKLQIGHYVLNLEIHA